MVVVRGRLTPEAGAALMRALDAAGEKLTAGTEAGRYNGQRGGAGGRCGGAGGKRGSAGGRRGKRGAADDDSTAEQRRADALGLVAEGALAGGLDPGTRGDRYQVVVHVDAEALPAGSERGGSALEDGQNVSAETARRLACDAAKVVMTHGADGSVLDVGRRTRTVPPALRRALAHRDRGCRFPGCGLRLCDAHHVEHWADGGATRLDNLIQLCRRHHRAVHEEGFTVELLAGGEARFRRPGGRVVEEAPALPPLSGQAVAALERRLARRSIEVDAAASLPSWEGGPVDYNHAVQHLRELDAAAG
jgi:hypothetical protein